MSLIPKSVSRRAKRKPVMRAIRDADGNGNGSNGGNGASPPFKMPDVFVPSLPALVVDIREHGAVADSVFDCTDAIAMAIDACARSGGGRVLIPPGQWLTGPIHLKSNIDVHISQGATLRFVSDPEKYLPPVFVRWGGQECYNYSPLIYARGCENIAITGRGQLIGQGKPWLGWAKLQQRVQARLYRMVLEGIPVEQRRLGAELPLRPQFIMPIDCTNVLLEDFTIAEAGPFWNVHVAYCRNVIVRGLKINAPDGPNNDGIVIDSSSDVLVEDCQLHTSDDAVALKSGMNEDGWRVGRPTENVVIRRVRATSGDGGIAIGSDMSGGVRNVLVHDCYYDGVSTGIRMKAARGRGGIVEDVFIHDIAMGQIAGDAIQITTEYSTFNSRDGKVPTFRNIHLKNITCEQAKTAVRMTGLADRALQNINLEHITITADEGLHCAAVNLFNLVDVKIKPRTGPVLSVKDGQEVVIHGLNNADSASVFLDLRGRQTRNIRLRGESNDKIRPAIVLGIDVPRDALVHE